MRKTPVLFVALALALAGAGCEEKKATQIIVAVATNLSVPKEMDNFDLKVERQAKVKASQNYVLDPGKPDSYELPATLAITAGEDFTTPVTITITGKKGNKEVISRVARLSFVEGRVLLLKIDLLRSCVGKTCSGKGQTCVAGACGSPAVDATKLPDYTKGGAFSNPEAGVIVDAAVDGPGPDAASPDAGADKGTPDKGGDTAPDASVDQALPDMTPDMAQPDSVPAGSIKVTAPTGGSHAAGGKVTITWSSSGSFGNVDIDLYLGTKKESTIAQNLPNSGSFIWTIPAYQARASTYLIKVTASKHASINGASTYFTIDNWQYRVTVSIDGTKLKASLTNYPVAVTLDKGTFSYANALSSGADLRFSSKKALSGTFDLPHWVQKWDPSGTSVVWVNVPQIAAGGTKDIHLFYGRAGATSTSDQAKTFPKSYISSGVLSLGGTFTYDWFELKASHVLTLNPGKPLIIKARRIVIDGTVKGDGMGDLGGKTSGQPGAGQGAGGSGVSAGGGGGAYGGAGGLGGHDSNDVPGQGGQPFGGKDTPGVNMGSGGGAAAGPKASAGGAGGGSFTLDGRVIAVTGTITMNGAAGSVNDTCGGGGAGGGVLLKGDTVSVAGTISVQGGNGCDSTLSNNDDGGGGGSGGRVKVFYDSKLSNKVTLVTNGGTGGKFGSKAYGAPGGSGTSHFGQTAYDDAKVTLGAENKL